jgi:hypothetical protein
MIRYLLKFCLVCPDGLSERAENRWYKDHVPLLKPLVDKMWRECDCEVELTPTRANELLKFLERMHKEKARTNGPWFEEHLIDDDKFSVEWFVANPTYRGECEGTLYWDVKTPMSDLSYPLSVRADRVKPQFHLSGWTPLVHVSEQFKRIVEEQRLTGIEFLWCRDVGKYRARQWYLPVCHESLGRGLDCPWIDARKLSGTGNQTLDPRGRHGLSGAFEDQYKAGAGPDDPVLKKLLKLLRSMEVLKTSVKAGVLSSVSKEISSGDGLRLHSGGLEEQWEF